MPAASTDTDVPEDFGPRTTTRAGRTNLLLAATIVAGDISGAVRIRNLSETGAMLEGASLPKVGRPLTLRRQELEMGAVVVWAIGSRCGIRFDGKISVEGWKSGTWVASTGVPDQSQVDAIQAAVRRGVDVSPSDTSDEANGVGDAQVVGKYIAEELRYLARLLVDMGDQLSDDPTIIRKYPQIMQNFDRMSQILEHLGRVVEASDQSAAVRAIGMEDLKARLLRQRLFR